MWCNVRSSHRVLRSAPTEEDLTVVLTLIAEVLAGETLVTPGGMVDTATACGLEAFTWDGWLEQYQAELALGAEAEAVAAERPAVAVEEPVPAF